ncbi:MAG: hypothetical protein JST04_16755 [Bdellovibrionales bacterium]|nr:hypothetical protein [Bdellovibrionales bacterium]
MDDLKKIQDAAESGDVSSLLDQMGGGDSGGLFSGFTFWGIFWGFAFSVFGWWIFKQGRKKMNPGLIGIGIALMVYPYFVTSPWPCFLIGAGLCGAARFIWDRY